MSFQGPIYTNAGKALHNRLMGSGTLVFTKMQMGDGTLSGTPIASLTALINPLVTMDVQKITPYTDYMTVTAPFTNAEITTAFNWREIGLFAADPDHPNDRSHDILFCYQNAYSSPDPIPPGAQELIERLVNIPIALSDVSNVTVTISASLIYALKDPSTNKIYPADIPDLSYIPTTAKGAASGVASLDSAGKVPTAQLPSMDYIPTTAKGAASGVAPLDANQKVPEANLPDFLKKSGGTLSGALILAQNPTADMEAATKSYADAHGGIFPELTVTAPTGSTVTCTKGSTTLTATESNGTWVFYPNSFGTWTISATHGTDTASKTVVIDTVKKYAETMAYIYITLTVTAPTGSTVTCTKGSTTLTATESNGTWVFHPDSYGTWTVTATKGTDSATDDVTMSSDGNYTLTLAYVKIYGVQWDKTATTAMSRTDDAALFTDPVIGVGSTAGSSPFDTCAPWSGMTKVTDGNNVLVKIPKFWYKITNTTGALKIQIADKATTGFSVCPMCADRGDGNGERDFAYIGRYKCNGSYYSKTGQTPKASITRAAARSGIAALGNGYSQQDFAAFWTIRMLFAVEFATWDSQTALGKGNNSGSLRSTGETDSMTYHTGHSSDGYAVQYRYIEDFHDNILEWCDGIVFSGAGICIYKNPANFTDTYNTTGATVLSISRPTSGGYISAWGVPTNTGLDWAMYPAAVAGSGTTYIPDYCSFDGSGVVLCVGGSWGDDASYGAFYLGGSYTASDTSSSIGARLQKLP